MQRETIMIRPANGPAGAPSAAGLPSFSTVIVVATLAFAVVAPPAQAEDPAPRDPDAGEFERELDVMKEKFDRLWDDVVKSMEPAIDRLVRTFEALERVDDFKYYEDPEVLENGDIIMRRKEDAPPLPPPGVDPEKGVDL